MSVRVADIDGDGGKGGQVILETSKHPGTPVCIGACRDDEPTTKCFATATCRGSVTHSSIEGHLRGSWGAQGSPCACCVPYQLENAARDLSNKTPRRFASRLPLKAVREALWVAIDGMEWLKRPAKSSVWAVLVSFCQNIVKKQTPGTTKCEKKAFSSSAPACRLKYFTLLAKKPTQTRHPTYN